MILAQAMRAEPRADVTWSVADDRWYQPDLGVSGNRDVTGLWLGAESIFLCSTVLAAVRFLSVSLAMCSAQVARRVGAVRRSEPDHYVQRVLRDPNARNTDFEWMELNVMRAATWGNAYNRIISRGRSYVDELIPLDPWRVRVKDEAADYSLIYEYTPFRGQTEILSNDEVLHFRGMSFDGMAGAAMYQLIRNAVGIALLAERHVGTFLRKGTRLGGLLTPVAPLDKEQRKELRDSFNADAGGPDKTGTIGLLPFGVDFKPMVSDNQKAQLGEIRDFQVQEILRFLGVPGVVVGYADKTATYASAKEFFESGGIKHCILPWLIRFERRIKKSLIIEPDVFVKFNLDVLLRANTKDRYESLFRAVGRPWMSGNEARAIEDMNPDEDPSMDEVAGPSTAGPTPPTDTPPDSVPAPRRLPEPPPPPLDEEASRFALAREFVYDRAAQVVRHEVAALKDGRAAARFARDPAGWRAWVNAYYAKHAVYVAQAMRMDEADASAYASRQRDALLAGGLSVVESWEHTVAPQLAASRLGEC